MDLIKEKRRWWKLVFFLWPGQKPNYPFWEPSKKFFFFFFWISFCRLGGYLQIFRKKVSLWFFKIKPFTDFWNWTHKNIPYQNIANSAISLYPTAQCTLPTCCFTEICNRILTYWSGALKSFIYVKMVLENLLKLSFIRKLKHRCSKSDTSLYSTNCKYFKEKHLIIWNKKNRI